MPSESTSFLASFHIWISVIAFMILGMAAVQASFIYLQNYFLRRTEQSRFSAFRGLVGLLPPMETMETQLFRIIMLGFIFLSISLISASAFVDGLYTAHHVHKIFLSALAWILFAILLLGRYRAGWRGPTAVRWTLMGVVLLMIAYFSSKLILVSYWS